MLQGSLASALGRGWAQEPDQDGARRASHAAASTSGSHAQQRARLPGRGEREEGIPAAGLRWKQRLQIAVDVAQGLAYLHQVYQTLLFLSCQQSVYTASAVHHSQELERLHSHAPA